MRMVERERMKKVGIRWFMNESVFGALEGWSSFTFYDFAETKPGSPNAGSRSG